VKINESTGDFFYMDCIIERNGRTLNCTISPHKYLNQIKGTLYIYQYDFNEQFKKDLIEEYRFIDDATDAPFMNIRNQQATAFLLTFNLDTLPYSLYIPGECADSVVLRNLPIPWPTYDLPQLLWVWSYQNPM